MCDYMRMLVAGIDRISRDLFCGVGYPDYRNKPCHGGLWASTFDKQRNSSAWLDWVQDNDFHLDKYINAISFTLNKSAKIYRINSKNDYMKLLKWCGYDFIHYPGAEPVKSIDFVKLSKYYDAVYISDNVIFDFELRYTTMSSGFNGFYCYDVESWILFNLDCINQGSIFNHNFKLKAYRY